MQYEKSAEYKLTQLLKSLRISATLHSIPEWSRNEDILSQNSVLKYFTKHEDNENVIITDEIINKSKLYIQRYLLCDIFF